MIHKLHHGSIFLPFQYQFKMFTRCSQARPVLNACLSPTSVTASCVHVSRDESNWGPTAQQPADPALPGGFEKVAIRRIRRTALITGCISPSLRMGEPVFKKKKEVPC